MAQSLSTNYSARLTRRTPRHAMALIGGLFERTRTKQPISSIKFYLAMLIGLKQNVTLVELQRIIKSIQGDSSTRVSVR